MTSADTTDIQAALARVRPPFRGPFARWPRMSDSVLALLLFLASIFVTFTGPDEDPALRSISEVAVTDVLYFAAVSFALIWRRDRPAIVLVVAMVASLLSAEPVFAIMVALYSLGRYGGDDRMSYLVAACAVAHAVLLHVIDQEPPSEIVFAVVATFIAWYLGRRIRDRVDYLSLLQERAAQLEREQKSRARQAVAEERTRIARELHDVVAHRVSMMTVQAGAAKTVAAADPEGAVKAMEAVEHAGRQALDELRHLLGVLRPETDPAELDPQPGIADIKRLVDQFTEAGLNVSLEMSGVETNIPAPVNLSVYRIVQEALTNVLKHAGPDARTELRVSQSGNDITVEVRNDGHGATNLPGSGHGIAGMKERAQLLGGTLDARASVEGGFQVTARLPLAEESQ